MKNVLFVAVISLLFVGTSVAGSLDISDTLSKIPSLKQGAMYDLAGDDILYLSTMQIVSYKNIALEGGYASDDKIVAVVSYPVISLKDFGVAVPIVELIELNVGFGIGVRDIGSKNEFAYGPTVTLINVNF